ncbi:MAG: A/G-specific adenine glycosylase [Micavibrio sp.]
MPRTMPTPDILRKDTKTGPSDFRRDLLVWYDKHARVLPWRERSEKRPDPYHVWLSEVMLQQTTVQAVIPYFGKFVDKWPTVRDLAAARDEEVMQEWAGLGYYARARNLLKCARVVTAEHQGRFPDTFEALKALPGIGDYTAAAVSSIAFDKVATVIDGNVDRVISRWFNIQVPLPDSKPEIRIKAQTLFDWPNADRPGDFAQAMMDLGAMVCTPKSPKCGVCPIAQGCQARIAGIAAELPRRKVKGIQPRRAGYVYWITNSRDEVLFETRPDKGLLGGMVGLPTSDWLDWPVNQRKWPDISHISAMKVLNNKTMKNDLRVRHSFTHFDLELQGIISTQSKGFSPSNGQFWVPAADISALGLPTLFKKFTRLMLRD